MKKIGLITDFGTRGSHYVAEMKGVALQINPEVKIIDITHAITPFSIREAAYVLRTVYDTFPKGTIFVNVVDPGVGSSRNLLAIQTIDDYILIGPDNGIFSYFQSHNLIAVILKIEEEEFFYPPFAEMIKERRKHLESVKDIENEVQVPEAVNIEYIQLGESAVNPNVDLSKKQEKELWAGTFHGRDIMMPVAAHLAGGLELFSVGSIQEEIILLEDLEPKLSKDGRFITGKIQYCDGFGNLITNIPSAWFFTQLKRTAPFVHLHFKNKEYKMEVSQIFAGHSPDQLLLVEGSSGFMEIAINQASAQAKLGIKLDDEIKIELLGGLFSEFTPQF
ncbi:SAM hydrolase/SAM-dependent halogenase family protein [Candidatus Harpocratesius sp.]